MGTIKVGSVGNDPLLNAIWYLATIATKNPKDVRTPVGKTVSFTTASSRANTKYQWQYQIPGSEEWKSCSGSSAKTTTYSFTAKAEMDGYLFRCLMTDIYGESIKTEAVTLNMESVPLNLVSAPESVTVKYGEKASVTVEAEGDCLTYTWYYVNRNSSTFSKSKTKGNTYSTTMSEDWPSRQVYCVIKDTTVRVSRPKPSV